MSPAAVNVSARLSRWRGASSLCLCAYATVWPEDSAVAALSSHDIACSFMVDATTDIGHAATRTWTRIDLFVLSLSPRCGPTGLLRGQGWHALSVLRYTSTSSGLQLLDLGTLISRSSPCARVWRERTCGLRYCIILSPTYQGSHRSALGQGPLSSACFSNPGTPRLCRGSDATRFTFVAGARPSLARQHGE